MLENPMPLKVEETNALPLTTGPSATSHLPTRSISSQEVTVLSDNGYDNLNHRVISVLNLTNLSR